MTSYAALIRGIMPTNPNMRNEKLRGVFEGLGFMNVRTVIASGNVLFETKSKNAQGLETDIERALQKQLGFKGTTIIRNREEIARLVRLDPFKGLAHNRKTSLNVTFLKDEPKKGVALPYRGKGYRVMGRNGRSVFSIVDLRGATTPDLMRWLEKEFGKELTTRTWKTVEKLLQKLDTSEGS